MPQLKAITFDVFTVAVSVSSLTMSTLSIRLSAIELEQRDSENP